MKFHISTMTLAICVLVSFSALAQTGSSAQTDASAQTQTGTKTTVILGKDDTTVILRPEGQPVAVIDVNQDILGKAPKKSNDAARDAVADAKQEVHPTAGADVKAAATGKEDATAASKTANDDRKTLDKAQTTGSNSAGSPGGDCIKESWGAGKSQDKSADQPQASSGKKCD